MWGAYKCDVVVVIKIGAYIHGLPIILIYSVRVIQVLRLRCYFLHCALKIGSVLAESMGQGEVGGFRCGTKTTW